MISTELTHRILIKLQNLPDGASIHSRQLEEEYQIAGNEVRKIMATLERAGHLIFRSNDGYRLAKSMSEYEESVEYYKKRAISIFTTIRRNEIARKIPRDSLFSIFSEINSISDKQIIEG